MYPSKWFSISCRPCSAPTSTGVTWSVNCGPERAEVASRRSTKSRIVVPSYLVRVRVRVGDRLRVRV